MKSFARKKLVVRLVFHFLLSLLLFLIPVIYKLYFATCCGMEVLLFVTPFYIIPEFIVVTILVFLAEYY
jgi:hypothetical protein